MLFLAIPLPDVPLQQPVLGAAARLVGARRRVLRLCGISVYLSGNVIDLGHFQMQVVEACDGLRYLFPLMTLGFIVAYFFQAPVWQRRARLPVEHPDHDRHEQPAHRDDRRVRRFRKYESRRRAPARVAGLGDLHGERRAAARRDVGARTSDGASDGLAPGAWVWQISAGHRRRSRRGRRRTCRAASPAPRSCSPPRSRCRISCRSAPKRRPQRRWFVDFPLTIDAWSGRHGRIEDQYLDVLALDDYLMADFNDGSNVVNVYAAYYESQRDGASVHSPRSCIPGGGWRITDFSEARVGGGPEGFAVNRALIELGDQRQLVYYWFKQRDRELTNELRGQVVHLRRFAVRAAQRRSARAAHDDRTSRRGHREGGRASSIVCGRRASGAAELSPGLKPAATCNAIGTCSVERM